MQTSNEISIGCCRDLKPLTIDMIDEIKPYLDIRSMESCEFGLTTLYLWKNRNHPHVYLDPNFMILFGEINGLYFAQMPLCKEIYYDAAMEKIEEVFEELGVPLHIYSVDQVFAEYIQKNHQQYEVYSNRDFADYIYDAEALRKLSGKKLRKKRNHINAFLRENEGNFEIKVLTYDNMDEINQFLGSWLENKDGESERIDEEIEGIQFVMRYKERLGAKAIGIYIDGKLEAFTIGSYINQGKEVDIHVEKADINIRGLYPYLSQIFLQEYFPEVELVNREDDLGLEGLRKSKLSYEPLRLEEKYFIRKK